jgi:hypothetical protein
MRYTVPILDGYDIIDRTDVNLTLKQIQELIDTVVIAVECKNFDDLSMLTEKLQLTIEEEEKTIPITLATIQNTCGWSKFCDVTGSNQLMLNEHTVLDDDVFYVKESDIKTLDILKAP